MSIQEDEPLNLSGIHTPVQETDLSDWEISRPRYFLEVFSHNGHEEPVKQLIDVYPDRTQRPSVIPVNGNETRIEAIRHSEQNFHLGDLQISLQRGAIIEALRVQVKDKKEVTSLEILGYDNDIENFDLSLGLTKKRISAKCKLGKKVYDPCLFFRDFLTKKLLPYYQELATVHPEFADSLLAQTQRILGPRDN
jgi:hypothetical protein